MLRDLTLPATLSRVLELLRSCFTAPTFEEAYAEPSFKLASGRRLIHTSAGDTPHHTIDNGFSGR